MQEECQFKLKNLNFKNINKLGSEEYKSK